MIQLIASIIFLASMVIVGVILYRKIPTLAVLPKNGHHGIKKPEIIVKIEQKIKERHFHFFKKQMLLHVILSKAMIWILKIERKISDTLHGIRQNAQELDKKVRRRK